MTGWITPKDVADIRSFGVTVIEQPGCYNKSDMMLNIRGWMLHHDALALGLDSNPNNDFNVPNYMGTPGILGSQFWGSTRGEVVLMAAGGKGHAGLGQWRAIPQNQGNNYCAAMETDHTTGTGWSNPLLRAIDVVSLVVIRNHNIDISNWVCGHLEYAPLRKQDPEGYNLNAWRTRMATGQIFGGTGQVDTKKCFGWW